MDLITLKVSCDPRQLQVMQHNYLLPRDKWHVCRFRGVSLFVCMFECMSVVYHTITFKSIDLQNPGMQVHLQKVQVAFISKCLWVTVWVT